MTEETKTRKRIPKVVRCGYAPSSRGLEFHVARERLRFLVWGIKSGKTDAGAAEFLRAVMGTPGGLCWVVAPTYMHTQAAERAFVACLNDLHPEVELTVRRHKARKEYQCINGALVQFRSADWPDNLRGPNVDVIWADEAAYLKTEAWHIIRGRVAATGGEIFVTTTPRGRNWLWSEVQQAGLPAEAPYGVFSKGNRWVSHFPTWEFPWVPKSELEEIKKSYPRATYDQEFGAMFTADSAQVFPAVDAVRTFEPPPMNLNEPTVIGVDLAKHQDWSAVVVMRSNGRVLHVDRWSRVSWTIQIERLEQLSRKWNGVLVIDASNVGDMVEENLRERSLDVRPVDMNNPGIKIDLIQSLQLAFERGEIKIPHPSADWAGVNEKHLLDELQWYQFSTTLRGRMSYSAPRGLTDDMVIALALANWGRGRGYAGGSSPVAVAVGRDNLERFARTGGSDAEFYRELDKARRAPRLKTGGKMFGPGSRLWQAGENLWKRG